MHKSYISVVLFLVAVCLFACKKQASINPQVQIVGKWNFVRWSEVAYLNGVKNLDSTLTPAPPWITYRQFNSDGTYDEPGGLANRQYSVTGDILRLTIP